MNLWKTFAATALATFACESVHAQCPDKFIQKLVATGTVSGDHFGRDVAIGSDGTIVITAGDPFQPVNGNAGYVFEETVTDTWTSVATLTPSDPVPSSHFGYSAAIEGNRIAIGAPFQPTALGPSTGAVYVFDRVNGVWSQTAKVFPPDLHIGDGFGYSVALQNGVLIVGAPFVHSVSPSYYDGVVYLLGETSPGSWSVHQKLSPPNYPAGAFFGKRLAVTSSVIVVSAGGETVSPSARGVVYVFEDGNQDGTWELTSRLLPPSIPTDDAFGYGIATDGARIAASYIHGSALAVTIFRKAGPFWLTEDTIVTTDAFTDDRQALSLSNGNLYVGSDTDYTPPRESGSLYVYGNENGAWSFRLAIKPSDAEFSGHFGGRVAAQSDRVVIAADRMTGNAAASGAAYVYRGTPNESAVYGASCPGSGEFTPRLRFDNSYDGCATPGQTMQFRVSSALGGGTCLLMLGLGVAQLPIAGPCYLDLVPSGPTAVLPIFGSGPGNGLLDFVATVPSGFPATSVYLQGFVADPGVARGFSATNGLRLTVH